jgi:hypothetical protein
MTGADSTARTQVQIAERNHAIETSLSYRADQIRLAIVCLPGTVQFSSRFREILSDDLRIFETCEDARLWLAERPQAAPTRPL